MAALLLCLHGVLAWLARAPGVETAHDDARYLFLGRALRAFSYRELWRTDAPSHNMYPPGYPSALALVGSVFGERFDVFVALSVLSSFTALALAYVAVRRLAGTWPGMIVLVPLATSPFLLLRAGGISSEPLYMALSLGALLVLLGEQPSGRRLALAGALAIAAALTRSVGIALPAAIALHWALERRWRALAVLVLASGLTLGSWFAWSAQRGEHYVGESYIADARGGDQPRKLVLPPRIARNARTYATHTLPSAMTAPGIPDQRWDNGAVLVVLGAGLAAGVIALWRRWRVAALYAAATAAILAVWPWTSARFLVPLLPVIWTALALGFLWMAGRFGRVYGIAAVAIVALAFAASGARSTRTLVRQMAGCIRGRTPPDTSCLTSHQAAFFQGIAYIRDSLPSEDVVLSARTATVAWYAGRPMAGFQEAASQVPAAFISHLQTHGVRYALIASVGTVERDLLGPRLIPNCGAFAVERSWEPGTHLLRLSDASGATVAGACSLLDEWRRAEPDRQVHRRF